MSRHDVVVIGVGGIGSATVYHLAKRGVDVLGLEKGDIPNEMGSSYGTRITLPSGRDPDSVALQQRAYELWEDLETTCEEKLFYTTGSLGIGLDGSQLFDNELRACQEGGLEYEVLTGAEVSERFPAYSIPERYRAVFQPNGGFLDAERCNVAHLRAAQNHGAEVHAREAVLDWNRTSTGIRVRTNRDDYEAQTLVVTSGAWVGKLMTEFEGVVTPARHITARFHPESPEQFFPETFPVFSMQAEEGFYYGTPVHRRPGVKIGRGEPVKNPVDPDADYETTPLDEDELLSFVERYLPTGEGPTMRRTTGLITWTPDNKPILDTLPQSGDVVVGAGFSGSGFKKASVFGEILADLALNGESTYEIRPFRSSRFG